MISVIVPLYNEGKTVEELIRCLQDTLHTLDRPFEVILVNDGSSDDTWEKVRAESLSDPHIKGIDLAGNYGQTIALRSGLEQSSGDIVIFMDGDMQHDPVDIPRFVSKIEEGYDMVGGAKQKRPEKFFARNLSKLAHWMIWKISGTRMSYFGGTYRAYRRFLLEHSNMLGDAHRFLGAMIARKGIRFTEIPIEIHQRHAGKSHYNFKKIFLVIIDLIFLKFSISYMNKPFRLFGLSGGVLLLAGLLPILYFIFGSLFFHFNIRTDYLTEFLFSFFIMIVGLLLISFGFVAEIGIHNYYAQKNNPPYAVREKAGEFTDE